MAGNKIQLKRTSVVGRVPTTGDLDVGELAINLADKRLFTKDGSSNVIDVHGQSLNTTAAVQFANVTADNIIATTITGNLGWSYITSKPDLKIDITGDVTGNTTFTDLGNGSINVTLANTAVTPGTYGNSSTIPVITVDEKGRITSATTNTVAGVTGLTYTSANNTLVITTGAGLTYSANINTITAPTISNANLTGNTVIAAVIANGTFGTSGQLLATDGIGVYWKDAPATSLDAVLAVGNTTTKALTVGPLTVGTGNTSLGNTVIVGNFTVTGTTTYVNTNIFQVSDEVVTLNADHSGTPTADVGFEVNRGTSANVALVWNETTDKWTFTNDGSTYYDIPTQAGTNSFSTIAVAGQTNIVADSVSDTLTFANGVGIEITTDPLTDTITILNTGVGANAFGKIVIAGQANVVAEQAHDTLTLVAGSGVQLATDDTTDTITISAYTAAAANQVFISAIDTFTANGTATTFTLGNTATQYTAMVAVDGILQKYTDDYTFSNTTLSFTTAPLADEIIKVYHIAEPLTTTEDNINAVVAIDNFTANGTSNTYTLSANATSYTAFVIVDGQLQAYTTDYTLSGTTLSFVENVLNDSHIAVIHLSPSVDGYNIAYDTFTGNGSNTQFTTSRTGTSVNCVVTVDGLVQKYTDDYAFVGNVLTFTSAIASGEEVGVYFFLSNGGKKTNSIAFTGNGSNTQFTLPGSYDEENILVYVEGLYKHPGEDYYVSGTTLGFYSAPSNNAKIRIRQIR